MNKLVIRNMESFFMLHRLSSLNKSQTYKNVKKTKVGCLSMERLGASMRMLGASMRMLGASMRKRLGASIRMLGASMWKRLGASMRRLGASLGVGSFLKLPSGPRPPGPPPPTHHAGSPPTTLV